MSLWLIRQSTRVWSISFERVNEVSSVRAMLLARGLKLWRLAFRRLGNKPVLLRVTALLVKSTVVRPVLSTCGLLCYSGFSLHLACCKYVMVLMEWKKKRVLKWYFEFVLKMTDKRKRLGYWLHSSPLGKRGNGLLSSGTVGRGQEPGTAEQASRWIVFARGCFYLPPTR